MKITRRLRRGRAAAATALAIAIAATTAASASTTLGTATLPDRSLGSFQEQSLPGTLVDDRGIRLGGIGSDLFRLPSMPAGVFWMITDRGPNGRPTIDGERRRTFPVPEFDPTILRVQVTPDGRILVTGAIPILTTSGEPVTGLPNLASPGPGGDPYDEVPWNFDGSAQLALNPNGLDTEGLVIGAGWHYWVVDEYGPSILEIDGSGHVLRRIAPEGLGLDGSPDYPVDETLPGIYRYRRQNRGFEGLGIAPDRRTMFAALQSPLLVPDEDIGEASRTTRILRLDARTGDVTGEFAYRFEPVCEFDPAFACGEDEGEMKVSGLIAVSPTRLLVLERTDAVARVYEVDLSGATNLLGGTYDDPATAPSLESLDDAGLAAAGIVPLPKKLFADLEAAGAPDKVEGIALVGPRRLAIANDNDFGMTDGATWDPLTGELTNDTGLPSQIVFVAV